jgi:hypothetical protein
MPSLANYIHDHTRWRAPCAGAYVLSECMAARSLAQCVELVEAVEASGCITCWLRIIPHAPCQELRRLYHSGEIGQVRYAGGRIQPPLAGKTGSFHLSRPGTLAVWWLPPTYYVTHALARLMMATDTLPVRKTPIGRRRAYPITAQCQSE